jgi:hypothetical protein
VSDPVDEAFVAPDVLKAQRSAHGRCWSAPVLGLTLDGEAGVRSVL